MINRLHGWRAAAVAVAVFAAGAANAAEPVPQKELPPELRQLVQAIISQPRVSPGVTFGSPIGFGAAEGDVFFGINGATASSLNNDFIGDIDVDGSMAVGFGIGDPVDAIGLEVALNIISLTDSFGDAGALAFKFHRKIGERGALAIGTENTVGWGAVDTIVDATTSTEFIAYSHYFTLRDDPMNPGGLMVNVGVGDGRLGQADDPEEIAPFVSVGYNITRQFSVIADYAGEAANIGISVVPWRDTPLSIVLGATDVTEERADTEFAFGIGYSAHFE